MSNKRTLTEPSRPIRMAPVSVTEAERERIQRLAAERGVSVAEWMRSKSLAGKTKAEKESLTD